MYSLVLGVAFLTVEYSISFEDPLTFLTLLPLSTGYFFMGELVVQSPPPPPTCWCSFPLVPVLRDGVGPAALPGADAVRVARHRPGLRGLLLPAGPAGGPRPDLVPDAARAASGHPQRLAGQPQRRFRQPLDPRPHPARSDGGDELRGKTGLKGRKRSRQVRKGLGDLCGVNTMAEMDAFGRLWSC